MSIVLDSLRPNDACREQIGPNDRCRVEANFHTVLTEPGNPHPRVTRMEDQDTLRFRREVRGGQLRFVLDQPALNSIFRALTMTHQFNPEGDANLQAAFNFSVVLTPFLRGFFEEFIQRQGLQGPEIRETFERFLNYLMVGEIHHPDSLQQEQNFDLYRRALLLSPEAARGFRDFLIGVLLDGNRSRLSPAMADRLDRLREIMNLGHRIHQALPVLPPQGTLSVNIREALVQVVRHLYRAEGGYDSVMRRLRPLALTLYRESDERHLNLYQILRTTLEPLRGQAPFQRDASARDRMQLLLRALELPGLAQDLELSALEPREALERSVAQGVSAALPSAPSAGVRETVHAVFSALQFTNASEAASLSVDPAALRNLRFQMDQVLTRHSSQRRDFARLFLGVLDFLAGPSRGFRGFWNGEMRQLNLTLDASGRGYVQSLRSWLDGVAGPGAFHPERLALPLAEGALCLAGGGLIAWGALAPPAASAWNVPLIMGGGVTGLGCGALATHFAIPSRNRYAADAIGGGVGAVIGVGIPILIHLLGGGAGMPPIDGRNPVTGRGP